MNKPNESDSSAAREGKPDTGRRNLLKLTGVSIAALGAGSLLDRSNGKAQTMSQDWDKVFPEAKKSITRRSRSGTATA